MRLYGAIQKIEPQDDGTVRVHGVASSEVMDDQGEIVRADAMRAAVPDYMRFPALREMHQLSAAGTTLETEVGDDGITRIVAHVVDPVAVAKVRNQVYRGFSIGGRVTQREAGNPKVVTGLVLNEISLVDRPANPEAILDCWKAAEGVPGRSPRDPVLSPGPMPSLDPFNPPVQIWTCGVADHHHRGKGEAVKCLERRALGGADVHMPPSPRATRVAPPADTRETEATVDAIKRAIETADGAFAGTDGHERSSSPGGSLGDQNETSSATHADAVWDAGHVAQIINELDRLRDTLKAEAVMEGDGVPQPDRLQAIIAELYSFLNALEPDRSDEVRDNPLEGSELTAIATGNHGVARVSDLPKSGCPNMQNNAASPLTKTKPSQGDQLLADMALYACDKCLKIDGLSVDERAHMTRACDHLRDAGASPSETSTIATDLAGDTDRMASRLEPPTSDFRAGVNATVDTSKMSGSIAAVYNKRGRAHQDLMDIAHECLSKMTTGMACSEDLPPNSDFDPNSEGSADTADVAKSGARHSAKTMGHLRAAHNHLVAAGAECDATATREGKRKSAEFDAVKALQTEHLAKVLADERAEKTALVKALGEIVPLLDRLSKRIDDIARTPLPPLTIARGSVSVSKQQDGGSTGSADDGPLSPEAIASALAKMSKEEQTLTLIKASYANPITVVGSAAGER
jgi:hypothetical protein